MVGAEVGGPPRSDTTQRESPALATISCFPRIRATTAVVPLSEPGWGSANTNAADPPIKEQRSKPQERVDRRERVTPPLPGPKALANV